MSEAEHTNERNTPASSTTASTTEPSIKEQQIIDLVNQIKDEKTRESALNVLSKQREVFSDLALYIWYSTGTVSALLQEIIYTYQLLAPPKLDGVTSNRACNVLALFQCVAAHSETRPAFLAAQIPIFLYPFLNTVNKTKPFEYLRLTAWGVIGALVKVDNPDVITFLLSTEIIPLCLRIMERGSELSKTVATFIVQRILLDEKGLDYICNTAERFYAISSVWSNMINNNPSGRLVKHIIRSYARLADNTLVRGWVKDNIPASMKDPKFVNGLDESSKRWMLTLMKTWNENQQNNIPQINPMQNQGGMNQNMGMGMMGNMVMNQMNMGQIPQQQGYMMQPNNDYGGNYGMYNNDNYMMDPNANKGMYAVPSNPYGANKNMQNMNMYYNFKNYDGKK